MTLPAGLRERLAASIQLQLQHKGLGGSVGDALAIADRALADAQVAPLVAFVAAAHGAASGFETVADGGDPPADLEDRRTAWTAAQATLTADPLFAAVLP